MTDLSHIATFTTEVELARNEALKAIDALLIDLQSVKRTISADGSALADTAERHRKLATACFNESIGAKTVMVNDTAVRIAPDIVADAVDTTIKAYLADIEKGLNSLNEWVISIKVIRKAYDKVIENDEEEAVDNSLDADKSSA